MPFYFSLTVFRVGSTSLVIAALGVWATPLYAFFFLILFFLGSYIARRRYSLKFDSMLSYWKKEKGLLTMLLRSTITTVKSKYQMESLYQAFWFLTNHVIVFGIAMCVQLDMEQVFSLDEVKLFRDKTSFMVVVWTIFVNGWISIVLFNYQIREENEEIMYGTEISKLVTQVREGSIHWI